MGKQVNLYLRQADILKIQNYLVKRKFVFLKDEASFDAQSVDTQELLNLWECSGYISFENARLKYRSFQKDGMQLYSLSPLSSEAIGCTFFDQKEGIYRFRFYYPDNLIDEEDKKDFSPGFELSVERFFRWLRRQFKRVPEMRTFYYNPDFPPKEWF